MGINKTSILVILISLFIFNKSTNAQFKRAAKTAKKRRRKKKA